jgi:hypothetical protein
MSITHTNAAIISCILINPHRLAESLVAGTRFNTLEISRGAISQ